MGRRAAICARVSTADQSCERQVSELTSFAERCGFAVAVTFRDTAPEASASRAARKKVMDLAQARQIDDVLVSEFSRWGRSIQHLLATLHHLAGWKVSVVAMYGMTFELDTPHGRMMATVLSGIAQFARDLISERVTAGMKSAAARESRLGRTPLPSGLMKEIRTLAASTRLSIRESHRKIGRRASRGRVGEITKQVQSPVR